MKPFWLPVTVTSTPQASIRYSIDPTDDTPSTNSSAGCLASSMRAADGGNVGPDAGRGFVVRRQHRLDHVVAVGLQRRLDLRQRRARAPGRLDDLHVQPWRWHMSIQRWLNMP